MSARREKSNGHAAHAGGAKRVNRPNGPLHPDSTPAGEFLPPGFEVEVRKPVDGKLVTYFVEADKRGISRYVTVASKYFHDSFRAVLLAHSGLVFDRASAKLVGRLEGDQFDRAVEWAKRNVLDEYHARFLLQGGGAPREREAVIKKYMQVRAQIAEQVEKLHGLERELEKASVALVERFGRAPVAMDGFVYDPSYAREKIFWKRRVES